MPQGWTGKQALGSDGAVLGVVEDVYLDRTSGQPAFALVSNGSSPGQGAPATLVPLAGATERDGALVVGFGTEQIAGAPLADPAGELTAERELEIYAHYGISRDAAPGDQPTEQMTAPPPPPPPPPPPGEAMTVSEEQLVVDKVSVPHEHVRVRKQVVEEQVTVTVTLRREELVVERQPVADPDGVALAPGTEIGENEMSFFLLAEQPVIGTRVVPVEQVRIRKEIVEDEQPVSENVRRERVDVEHDDLDATVRTPTPAPPDAP